MQLNKFTDLGIRILILLYQHDPHERVTIEWLSRTLNVSKNHLMKIVHFMAIQGWVRSFKGRGGGILLDEKTHEISVGVLIKKLEGYSSDHRKIINCDMPQCSLKPICCLPLYLSEAIEAFYGILNQYFLKDIVLSKTGNTGLWYDKRIIENKVFAIKNKKA